MINERIQRIQKEAQEQVVHELQAMAWWLRRRELLPEIQRDHALAKEQLKAAEARVQGMQKAIADNEAEDRVIEKKLIKLGNAGTFLINVKKEDTPGGMNYRREQLRFQRSNLLRELQGENGAEKALAAARQFEEELGNLEALASGAEPWPDCQNFKLVLHEMLQREQAPAAKAR